MIVKLIAAVGRDGIIGDRSTNDIPWRGRYPEDFKFFKQMTTGGAVVFGKNTFRSLPKPLPNRANIVITREEKIEGAQCYSSLESWRKRTSLLLEDVATTQWICGGEQIYRNALQLPELQELYLSLIPEVVGHVREPVYFPWIDPSQFSLVETFQIGENGLKVAKYQRVPHNV